MAITRKTGKQINLQRSRILRSRAIPLVQPVKGPPLQQPPQNCRRRAHPSPEDIGVPTDGKWDHTAAYECRFCVQHEEDEWLLGSVDRWMYPSDFNIPEAEAVLEAKLLKYKSKPYSLQNYKQASRVECNDTLWSQIDTPIQRDKLGDKVIYLIRWKLCWTPQSHIDDMEWVHSSFNAQNECIGRRRSVRVKDPESAAKKREAMMVVVKLEELL